MGKTKVRLILITCICCFLINSCKDYDISAVTGATPVARSKKAEQGISLKITGELKREYNFTAKALNAHASMRIRTHEVSPEGKMIGTYVYMGIPLLYILEGVAPAMPEDREIFDRPLDMIVTVKSASGNSAVFSYGEIEFTNDSLPALLAYDRQELKPTKDPEKYDKNLKKGTVKGLCLAVPRDSDTGRYVDDVVEIILNKVRPLYKNLPVQKKGEKCGSRNLVCVKGTAEKTAVFAGVPVKSVSGWFRTGHGQGFKGISSASGYSLRDFLKKNFPGCGKDDFFLFSACDGYRCLLSGREVFDHYDGGMMLLLGTLDGVKADFTLAPVNDYFVDRDVRGLTHVVMLEKPF